MIYFSDLIKGTSLEILSYLFRVTGLFPCRTFILIEDGPNFKLFHYTKLKPSRNQGNGTSKNHPFAVEDANLL